VVARPKTAQPWHPHAHLVRRAREPLGALTTCAGGMYKTAEKEGLLPPPAPRAAAERRSRYPGAGDEGRGRGKSIFRGNGPAKSLRATFLHTLLFTRAHMPYSVFLP